MALAGIILAAGKGTRMKSELPKALHRCCGVPMVELVARALSGAGISNQVLVIGHGAEQMREQLAHLGHTFAYQGEQLGTGHATLMAREFLASYAGPVIVTPGDTPLLTSEAILTLLEAHLFSEAKVTVATFRPADPTGYGRVVRNAAGSPIRIVEHKDASPGELEINEVNSSVYCFDSEVLFKILPSLRNTNAQGEYYLTDVLKIASEQGLKTAAQELPEELFLGVNDRWQLAQAGAVLQRRILRSHAESGVTIIDPETTRIGADVKIGHDTVVEPMTVIEGHTTIGMRCQIGPHTRIISSQIGDEARVVMSHVNETRMASGAKCGPYANLRPGTEVLEEARVGSFVEVKKSKIGKKSAVAHLAYVGDTELGDRSNIGGGTITCNYDGFQKHRTEIGDGAFIGSNATLVAPVKIGDGAYVAAGSTITEDVEEDALALGRARQVEKESWAQRWREKNTQTS